MLFILYIMAKIWTGTNINGEDQYYTFGTHHSDQRNENERTNAANMLSWNMMSYQNDWNLQQWNRQNAYNAPANQLKLLEEAGMNPLFYADNAGKFAGAADLNAASADTFKADGSGRANDINKFNSMFNGVATIGDQVNGIMNQMRQEKKLSHEISLLDNQSAAAAAQAADLRGSAANRPKIGRNIDADTVKKGAELDEIGQKIQNMQQEVIQSQAYTRLLFAQGENQEKINEKFEETWKKDQKLKDSAINLQFNQSTELLARAGLSDQQAKSLAWELQQAAKEFVVSKLNDGTSVAVNARTVETYLRTYSAKSAKKGYSQMDELFREKVQNAEDQHSQSWINTMVGAFSGTVSTLCGVVNSGSNVINAKSNAKNTNSLIDYRNWLQESQQQATENPIPAYFIP